MRRALAGMAILLAAAPGRAEDCAGPLADAERHRAAALGDAFPNPWPDALLPLAAARDGPCPTPQESERP